MRIVDPDGGEVAAGEIGEIVVRGPLVMAGYAGHPEETAARFREGWHHTVDLGRREADGSVTFVGPKTVFIKTGNENIYPVEVERCLLEHPAVAAVCVIGEQDPTWGQNVKAVVVRAGDVDADELIAWCRSRIASYKKPKLVVFTDALPGQGGSVDRTEVDRLYGGGGYPGHTTSGQGSATAMR
jgi:long-chain acyl-CoA synthetase